ncbi:hypothetical protein CDAR_192371 [Caerostris darwini]|uniref:Uncharacterized protein n=1 Tax=Caerostris darwini TaxID=1538125 RepID=A0AAV4RG57_9ARAC|nr:hypothetical protein CDAR_192371 [Caerostris darwini]
MAALMVQHFMSQRSIKFRPQSRVAEYSEATKKNDEVLMCQKLKSSLMDACFICKSEAGDRRSVSDNGTGDVLAWLELLKDEKKSFVA